MSNIYAHTLPEHSKLNWEPLYHPTEGHAERVASLCAQFCSQLSSHEKKGEWGELGHILGLFHDMGKASRAFQSYMKASHAGKNPPSVDHKTAAAKWVNEQRSTLRDLLAYVFYAHHGGLPHGVALMNKLREYTLDEALMSAMPQGYQQLSVPAHLSIFHQGATGGEAIFAAGLFVRMLHSSLVDADWLATEAFTDVASAQQRAETRYDSLAVLSTRLEQALAEKESTATGAINELRKQIHASCYQAARRQPSVYRLNVPTGGGKTLASLSFALHHAQQHQLSRVIYVIPYTSIIEQTAREFRAILGDDQVVEHHSNIAEADDNYANRYACENWDAPVIVTTNVQFFESLFACKNKSCRKVHNMARAVIIFDEAQSLPCEFLAPCLAAMKTLQRVYGASLLLCTATQPALENRDDGFDIGWQADEMQSLLGESLEQRLYHEMKRVDIEFLGSRSLEELIEHFVATEQQSALFIVNFTRQAQDLYQELSKCYDADCLFHLSARMCPAHRTLQLDALRARLAAGRPTILVATRVVEAGVDISFPLVYRDRCGLDSLAQSAGRCNRHGELTRGKTYAFQAREDSYQLGSSFADALAGDAAMRETLAMLGARDILEAEVVHCYFRYFYAARRRQCPGWDREEILELIGQHPAALRTTDYPEIAKRFKLIPDGQSPLMMPYGEAAQQLRAELLELQRQRRMPTRAHYRRIAQLSINLYANEYEKLRSSCECIHDEARIMMLCQPELYDDTCGLLNKQQEFGYIY